MIDFLKKQLFTVHQNGKQQVSDVFKYIGPGIIRNRLDLSIQATGPLTWQLEPVMVTNYCG